MLCSGCAARSSGGESFDGLDAGQARELADHAAQEIVRRYSPARTPLALDRAPGPFGDEFERALRGAGFAVSDNAGDAPSGTAISYTVDILNFDGAPPLGYVRLRLPEGRFFSFSKELRFPLWPAVTPEPEPTPAAFAEKTLPPAAQMVAPMDAPSPAPASVPASGGTMNADAAAPPHKVRTTATAARVAKRNKVPVADFCRWNDVRPEKVLPVGYRVYLRASEAPEASPAPIPAPVPVPSPVAVASPAAAEAPAPSPAPTPDLVIERIAEQTAEPVTDPSTWGIAPGPLRAQLSAWAARAGYQTVWRAANDYEMESHARFQGDFLSAVQQLFTGLQRVGIALRVTVFKSNNVLEVMEN